MGAATPRLLRLLGLGPQIRTSWKQRPDGLLLHEDLVWSLVPPHRVWWQQFLKDAGGTDFWHETYLMGGGMEAIYDDMPALGMARFVPMTPARGG